MKEEDDGVEISHSRGAAGTPRVATDMLSVRWCSLDHAMVLTAAVSQVPCGRRYELCAVPPR